MKPPLDSFDHQEANFPTQWLPAFLKIFDAQIQQAQNEELPVGTFILPSGEIVEDAGRFVLAQVKRVRILESECEPYGDESVPPEAMAAEFEQIRTDLDDLALLFEQRAFQVVKIETLGGQQQIPGGEAHES